MPSRSPIFFNGLSGGARSSREALRERLLDLREILWETEQGRRVTTEMFAALRGYDSLRGAERRIAGLKAEAERLGFGISRVKPSQEEGGAPFIEIDNASELALAVERELEIMAREDRHEARKHPELRRPSDQRKIDEAVRVRQERVAAGLCATEGCPSRAQDDTLFCRRCRATQGAATTARREKLKHLGVCTGCGRKRTKEGEVLCDECSAHRSDYLKKYRGARAEAGMCTRCGNQPPIEGFTHCEVCRTISRAKQTTDDFRARRRALKEERRAKGLCAMCQDKAVAGRTLCDKHLRYMRERQAEYNKRKRGAAG